MKLSISAIILMGAISANIPDGVRGAAGISLTVVTTGAPAPAEAPAAAVGPVTSMVFQGMAKHCFVSNMEKWPLKTKTKFLMLGHGGNTAPGNNTCMWLRTRFSQVEAEVVSNNETKFTKSCTIIISWPSSIITKQDSKLLGQIQKYRDALKGGPQVM